MRPLRRFAPLRTLPSLLALWPAAVAVDAAGNVYVADMGNNAVKEIVAATGAVNTLGSGFRFPSGVAVDANGRGLYAIDCLSLWKFTP